MFVFKAELKPGTKFLLSGRAVYPPHRCHGGQNECFDDFGIAQEDLKPICFSAGPLTEAQALSIQATASCCCCLYSLRSDRILASNHKKKKKRDSGGAEEEREEDVHKCHLQLVWLYLFGSPWSSQPFSLTCCFLVR